jgi:hypothetical protein
MNRNPIDGVDFVITSGIIGAEGIGFLNDNFLGIQHYSSLLYEEALHSTAYE